MALARALAIGPDIILLDEPFSSLDAALRVSLRRQVKGILSSAGVTAVLVTHDQEEALAMADYLAVMNAGRIAAFGTPSEIRRRPPDAFTASFLGRAGRLQVLRLSPDGLLAHTRAGTVRLPAAAASAGTAALMIRPEALTPSKKPAGSESVITGRIVLREYRGRDWALQLIPADESSPGLPAPRPGRSRRRVPPDRPYRGGLERRRAAAGGHHLKLQRIRRTGSPYLSEHSVLAR